MAFDLSNMQFGANSFQPNELANAQLPYGLGNYQQAGNMLQPQGGMMQNFQQGVQQTSPGQDFMRQAMEAQQNQKNMEAYKMIAQGIQGMAPRQQMPSGNTAQIIRDQNQFRFAGNPQQQMAQALRRR